MTSKVAYLWQFGFFFLCSPDCPKQPRIDHLFYRFLYPIICGAISGPPSPRCGPVRVKNEADNFVKVLKCVCMMLRFISTIGSLDNYYITAFWQFFLKMNRVSGNRVIWNCNNGGIFLLVFLINDMTHCIIRIVSHGFFKVIV